MSQRPEYSTEYEISKTDDERTLFEIRTESAQIAISWVPGGVGVLECDYLVSNLSDILYSISIQEGVIPHVEQEVNPDPAGQ